MSSLASIQSIAKRRDGSADGGLAAGAARFREQLASQGPLHRTFAQFLSGRTDLLPTDYATALGDIDLAIPPMPKSQFGQELIATFGALGETLAAQLEDQPVWSTLDRCAYRTMYDGRKVLVQTARPPLDAKTFHEFKRSIRSLGDHRTPRATGAAAIAQFEEWLRLSNGVDRERAYLEGLAEFKGLTTEYPKLIPGLCGGTFLSWAWVEGTPLNELKVDRPADAAFAAAEFVLEQFLLLTVVDTDLDLSQAVRLNDGRVAIRRASRLAAMPPQATVPSARYISSVLSSDTRTAAHLLAKLASDEVDLEPPLIEKLSNLEPELKVNFRLTTTLFENNWRALAAIHAHRPMYLDFMHRNLLALSRWSADARSATRDIVTEAYWTVLMRVLRKRFFDNANPENLGMSLYAGSMLLIEGMRQVAHLADGLRDDELSFRVAAGSAGPGETEESNRRVRKGIGVTVLLVALLVTLHWSGSAPPGFSTAAGVAAGVCAVTLLWILLRME
ncbi:MAG: hypothetical protein ABL967_07120 [Bryobacteraceae bacterium]